MRRLARILAVGFFVLFALSTVDLLYIHLVKAPATPWTLSEFLKPVACLVDGLAFQMQSR